MQLGSLYIVTELQRQNIQVQVNTLCGVHLRFIHQQAVNHNDTTKQLTTVMHPALSSIAFPVKTHQQRTRNHKAIHDDITVMSLGTAAISTPTQNNHNIIYNHSSSMDNVYNQEIVSHLDNYHKQHKSETSLVHYNCDYKYKYCLPRS